MKKFEEESKATNVVDNQTSPQLDLPGKINVFDRWYHTLWYIDISYFITLWIRDGTNYAKILQFCILAEPENQW